uniref:Bm11621 n=1 Tax=Brugia malayi TaxID=6279 RepID=A0A1I9G9I7_BRUMA|nr:Bm11621 [Brugia malayi]
MGYWSFWTGLCWMLSGTRAPTSIHAMSSMCYVLLKKQALEDNYKVFQTEQTASFQAENGL